MYGSHYLPYKEFLNKGMSFWFGGESQKDIPVQYDDIIETICAKGCDYVNEAIGQYLQGKIIDELMTLEKAEQEKIVGELDKIMQVYSY